MHAIGAATRRGFVVAASGGLLGMFTRELGRQPKNAHRRVVTGVDPSGKSTVVSDGSVPTKGTWAEGGEAADLWFLSSVPVDLTDSRDPIAGSSVGGHFPPPPGGVTAMIFTWQPGFSFQMHRTATIDFIIIVSGRLELLLDSGKTIVGPGDCVVQRGTRHGWRVAGSEPCTFAAIGVGANA